ncbi:sarcosine oxidase subunit gamma [Pseudooceanicola aestuarii]|uniref:sarcosine oxidase subunit gamma n=1 Tax=Pseudooceanicola aestuarii TaxID=2697319 RepID=UPI0013CFC30F|nr:sarcosine oxidase subunit gamma family protein [Pseudooceanicola aestuarii]
MSDPLIATPAPVPALGGAQTQGRATLRELPMQGMITLRGDLADPALRAAATGLTGRNMPERRGISSEGDRAIAWMSPDEALLLLPLTDLPQAMDKLGRAFAGMFLTAVDVSHARALFALTGPDAAVRETLAKLAPVDMAPGRFEPGELRRTRLAQVPAAFWMPQAGEVRLVCFRSVAGYVQEILTTAAADGGETGLFAAPE